MSNDTAADTPMAAARASPAALLPASMLCLSCSFLTAPPPALAAATYSTNAAPRLSAHSWLLTVVSRVCRGWRSAVQRSEAFNNECIMRVALLTAEEQTEQAQSQLYTGLYSLLQPRASGVRALLQHLVLAVPPLPGKYQAGQRHQRRRAAGHIFPADGPQPPSLQALLAEARWPALRSITIVGATSAECALHVQSDRTLHALWHTIAEHSTTLFPKLHFIEFRSVSFTASLLTLRPGAAHAATSCCSQSAFKLLASCAQLDRLCLVQVYAEPSFGYDLARMQHLRDLRVFSTHIEGIQALQLRSLTRAHDESRPARTCIFIREALSMPHALEELTVQGPLCAEAMRALCLGQAATQKQAAPPVGFAAATGSTTDTSVIPSALRSLRLLWAYTRPYSASLRVDPTVFVADECWAAFDAHRFLQAHPQLTQLSLLQRTYTNQLDAAMHLLQMCQPLLPQLRLLQIHCDTDGMATALGKSKNPEKQARAIEQLQAEFRRMQGSQLSDARLEVLPQR